MLTNDFTASVRTTYEESCIRTFFINSKNTKNISINRSKKSNYFENLIMSR